MDADSTYSEKDILTPLGSLPDPGSAEALNLSSVPANLPNLVRETCNSWYQYHSDLVAISDDALENLAKEILQESKNRVVWDEEGWHYNPPIEWPATIRRERIALYILAMDSINFCFWPAENYEYEQLATSLKKVAGKDHSQQEQNLLEVSSTFFFSARSLQSMTVDRMQKDLVELPPNLELRCRLWNQIGEVLIRDFGGSAWNLIEATDGSAVRAVRLLFCHFAGFRDIVTTETNQTIYLLKRAQICVGDWKAALAEEWKVHDLDELTTFADYRLPQLLRQRGVLVYCNVLERNIDDRTVIPATSEAEISLRAATVVAVDRLASCLNRIQSSSQNWTAMSVDWYLWQTGEKLEALGEMKPHHRVRTIFY